MWQRIKNIYHLGNAILANIFYGFLSRKLTVIGVTGTDGKTTTTSLIYHILHEAGYNASMISSIGAIIGGKEYDVGFHVTTPSPWALQRFISLCHLYEPEALRAEWPELVSGSRFAKSDLASLEMPNSPKRTFLGGGGAVRHDNKGHFLVLEVTSHAIDQNRIWGILFDIAVLTNITHEHLDYHKTYENYVKTKAKLLKMARVAIVNRDDNSFSLVKSEIRNPKSLPADATHQALQAGETNSNFKIQKFITYGMNEDSEINPIHFPFKTNLIGEFNRYNVLAAVAACRNLGINDDTIRKAILSFEPPIGRGEIVYKNPFTIMVDFAHTPNAFEEILSSTKLSIKGRLIHVFGSAGLRDVSKRPLMGKSSAKYSNIIILTAEDPRRESVEKIISEVESGIMNHELRIKEKTLFKIPNRQEAITAAIGMAKKGDFVLITGKAHEKSMNYGKGEEPWDEYKAVRKALRSVIASDSEAISNGIATSPSAPRNDK